MVLVGRGGTGNSDLRSSSFTPRRMRTTGAATDLMPWSGKRVEGESQVTVRGVAGTSVKGLFSVCF
jgi:hypothetical protein